MVINHKEALEVAHATLAPNPPPSLANARLVASAYIEREKQILEAVKAIEKRDKSIFVEDMSIGLRMTVGILRETGVIT